jgi:hypothetical protein
MKKVNLKIVGKLVDQHHEEAAQRKEEEENYKLTPEEFSARLRGIRCYFEKVRDGLEGVPFAAVAHTPGELIRNIELRGDIETSIRDLVEYLHPFIKGWCEHCGENLSPELGDEFGFLTAGLVETGFALGIVYNAIVNGASDREIDRLERGFIHANKLRWWYREGSGK